MPQKIQVLTSLWSGRRSWHSDRPILASRLSDPDHGLFDPTSRIGKTNKNAMFRLIQYPDCLIQNDPVSYRTIRTLDHPIHAGLRVTFEYRTGPG